MKTLGEKIKYLRKERHLSLDELAKKSNTSKAYLWQLEHGETERPSAELLYNIAVALDTSIAALLGKEVEPAGEKDLSIPKNLEKAAVKHGIPASEARRLAALSMREGKKKQDYSEDDWFYLYQTIKRLG